MILAAPGGICTGTITAPLATYNTAVRANGPGPINKPAYDAPGTRDNRTPDPGSSYGYGYDRDHDHPHDVHCDSYRDDPPRDSPGGKGAGGGKAVEDRETTTLMTVEA